MAFPTSLPSYAGFTSSHTLSQDNHAAQHNQEQTDITAVATKIGTGSSTPTSNKVLRGDGVGTSSWSQVDLSTDITGQLPAANAANVLAAVYPIGSIYTETTGINPGITFGFGSWAAFGGGRVLIGAGTSDQVFTAGATGGESNHTLTTAELASHGHNITDPGHTHPPTGNNFLEGGAGTNVYTAGTVQLQLPTATGSAVTGITVNNAGSDNAHNNLQPYIVVYFWKRTA